MYGKIRKYPVVPTPYHWSRSNGDWRIGCGRSSFCVASGSAWSEPVGRNLLADLNKRYRTRQILKHPEQQRLRATRVIGRAPATKVIAYAPAKRKNAP